MIQSVIFDFDGVLVESVSIKTEAFGELFESEGEDVSLWVMEYHLKNTGVSRFDKFRHIYRERLKREIEDKDFEVLCRRFSRLVVDKVVAAPYVEGAKEFLDTYAGGLSCYIASATPEEEMGEIVKRRGMTRYFQEVHGAPTSKTDIVRGIIEGGRLRPSDIVYVGDAMSDYEAAKKNRVKFIARVAYGNAVFDTIKCCKVSDLRSLWAQIQEM